MKFFSLERKIQKTKEKIAYYQAKYEGLVYRISLSNSMSMIEGYALPRYAGKIAALKSRLEYYENKLKDSNAS